MERVTPVQSRKQLEASRVMTEQGIRFVPVPALNDADYEALVTMMQNKLDEIIWHVNKNETENN